MTNLIPQKRTAPIDGAKAAASSCLQQYLLARLSSWQACSEDGDEALRAATAFMSTLEPEDAVEVAFAAQTMAALEASMTCFSRAAAAGDNSGIRDIELRNAERFSNLYSRLVQAFEKRRHRLKIQRLLTHQPLAQVLQW